MGAMHSKCILLAHAREIFWSIIGSLADISESQSHSEPEIPDNELWRFVSSKNKLSFPFLWRLSICHSEIIGISFRAEPLFFQIDFSFPLRVSLCRPCWHWNSYEVMYLLFSIRKSVCKRHFEHSRNSSIAHLLLFILLCYLFFILLQPSSKTSVLSIVRSLWKSLFFIMKICVFFRIKDG